MPPTPKSAKMNFLTKKAGITQRLTIDWKSFLKQNGFAKPCPVCFLPSQEVLCSFQKQ